MVKSQRKTRKITSKSKKTVDTSILTIPQLRKAFDHMDKVVEDLRKMSHHSFSDAVVSYREEWRKTFKHDISPADAAAYLKFRFGIKSTRSMTRRRKTRGGSMPLAGAALDYQTRPGVDGPYGNFPTYQAQGLDRSYGSAINADCGKPHGFPTSPSGASQGGGGLFDGLFRPFAPSTSGVYPAMMTGVKGLPAAPSSDPVSLAATKTAPALYVDPTKVTGYLRTNASLAS